VAALELGSGGGLGDDPGSDAGGSAGAGAGGGSIRLEIGGRLALEGGIRADGAHAPAGTNGGGGSGGAIRIRCSDVVGGGFVRAHGGAGSGTGGGGGGGRVAIYAPCDAPVQFRGTVSVDGGPGSAGSDGADGSRFVSSLGTADCDEDGVPDACAIAAGDVPDRNGNGVPDPCEITLTLTVDPLIGGARSEATVAGGSPDTGVIVAWGFEDGRLDRRIGSWCSDFWFEIPDANPKSRIALQSTFDARGSYRGDFRVPPSLVGRRIRFQATQGRTCPEVRMSNVVARVVE